MVKYFANFILVFMMLILSETLYAQKNVTQFLGIPVDGYKSEMIQKLKSKGFTVSPYNKDILTGEFNGTKVNIHVVTNNNKVYRIMVADANDISEGDIKIRFNKLCQQFQNNKNYFSTPDSTILEYTIPESEDISYEISVNKKRYQAIFYQKTIDYDSSIEKMATLLTKESLTDRDKEQLNILKGKIFDFSFKKVVWFSINEYSGKYYISIRYDNEYNKANGEDL